MNRKSVSSSSILSVGYDSEEGTLEVEFITRSVYQYFNVPFSQYTALMIAPSHGEYFNENIKGKYSYNKIR